MQGTYTHTHTQKYKFSTSCFAVTVVFNTFISQSSWPLVVCFFVYFYLLIYLFFFLIPLCTKHVCVDCVNECGWVHTAYIYIPNEFVLLCNGDDDEGEIKAI